MVSPIQLSSRGKRKKNTLNQSHSNYLKSALQHPLAQIEIFRTPPSRGLNLYVANITGRQPNSNPSNDDYWNSIANIQIMWECIIFYHNSFTSLFLFLKILTNLSIQIKHMLKGWQINPYDTHLSVSYQTWRSYNYHNRSNCRRTWGVLKQSTTTPKGTIHQSDPPSLGDC